MDDDLICEDLIQRLRCDEQITEYEYVTLIDMCTRFKKLKEYVLREGK